MRKHLLGFALFAVSLNQAATAEPIAALDVPALVQAAELIVVARVQSPALQRLPGRTLQSYSLLIERTLKGEPVPPTRISVRLDLSPLNSVGVADRQYGMHFLRREGDVYTAANPPTPILVASPLRSDAPAPRDPLQGVAQELADVLATPGRVLTDPASGVQNLAFGDPALQAQQVYLEAASALGSIPFERAKSALDAPRASDPSGRIWSLFSLLQMGSSDQAEAQKAALLKSLQPELLSPDPKNAFSVFMLANAMEGHLIDPQTVPTLTALLGSREVAVRRAAASILGDIGTPDILAPLANVALADPDSEVRYYAVLGLHDATGIGNAPTTASFEEHQNEVLRFWRGWARANAQRLPQP